MSENSLSSTLFAALFASWHKQSPRNFAIPGRISNKCSKGKIFCLY